MNPKSFTNSQDSAAMPDYGNRSGSVHDAPVRTRDPRPPDTGSGKVPADPSKPLSVKLGTRIVVRNGRLVVVKNKDTPPTSTVASR